MKTIKLAIVCAAVLAAPATLRAADPGAAETPAVSTGTRVVLPSGLVYGYRGTSLPIGGDQLLYLKKGDRVDVLVTFDAMMGDKDKKERKEKITSTFLQNIVVINVRRPEKVDDAGAVELLLNPVEAQYAALAISQGNIHITVRALGDVELHPMEMASFRKLIK
ncbi:MAG: RcpC/CpaB family pilus assembly protein [Elusimicrobiota bacterium]|nr:RcpC/CpaB family pilus assembly protein [Elusimicrobiota bacterium]